MFRVFPFSLRGAARWMLLLPVCLVLVGFVQADDNRPAPAPYRVDHAAPLRATEKVVAEAKDHTQLRVEFNGIQGDRVPAFLYLPKGTKGKQPALLFQYGSGCDKSTPAIVAFARQWVAHGFVVLTIDSPLRGERAPRDMNRLALLRAQFDRDNFLHFCGDYSRAVDYLAARPEVDASRLGYVGISWGAITGITFVAHDPRLKAMAALVAGGDFLGPILGDTPEKARDIAREIDPVNHVGLIAPRPLLLLNVTQDKLIARPYAEALHKAAGKGATIVWFNTDHDFFGPDHDKIAPTVIRFLEENLRGSTPSTETPKPARTKGSEPFPGVQ